MGTYYAAGADAAKATPNAKAMRGLVYAVKDNREPPIPKQLVEHPSHPSRRPVFVDRSNAIEYVTAILGKDIAKLTRFFGARDPRAIALVPVPSSEVTAATVETARFPTLRLCRALAGVGLGTVAVLALQRERVVAKTKGARRSAEEILRGFARTPAPIPRPDVFVLVDDNVQRGNSVVALDRLLGAGCATAVFAVAITDAKAADDALKPRRFTIEYDEAAVPLGKPEIRMP